MFFLLEDCPASEFYMPKLRSTSVWSRRLNFVCRRYVLLLGDLRASEFYMPTFRSSFGWSPGVWILYADVSFFFWVISGRLNFICRRYVLLLCDLRASEFFMPTFRSSFGWSRRPNFIYRRFVLLLGDPDVWILYADVSFSFWVILRLLNFICRSLVLLLGDSPASEFYVPTFRNNLFRLHRWC